MFLYIKSSNILVRVSRVHVYSCTYQLHMECSCCVFNEDCASGEWRIRSYIWHRITIKAILALSAFQKVLEKPIIVSIIIDTDTPTRTQTCLNLPTHT